MTARPLLLVGAGGLARETLAAARTMPDAFDPLGFLDDDPARHGSHVDGLPVLGPSDLVHSTPDAFVLLCVGNPARPTVRLDVAARLALPASRYATLVHPAASVAVGTELGPGCVFLAGAVITAAQQVGAHVVAMPHVLLTHDDEVGDGVTFAGRATLSGSVHVGRCAYLGAGALVRQGLKIGDAAVIGMGAVVLTDVPPGETWVGNPARPLRTESP